MQVTICGHAGVLVDTGATRLLVDPVLTDRFAGGAFGFHPPRRFDVAAFPDLDAVLVTHAHLDHWHPASLEVVARDRPLLLPDHDWLVAQCRDRGFDVRVLRPWDPVEIGTDLTLLPTPSEGEIDEIGFVAIAGGSTYWHMSDAVARPVDGERILDEVGPVGLAATRFQPVNPLVAFQRGLGSSFDERPTLIDALHAVRAARPSFVFPYFAGIRYLDEHDWANRYAFPYHHAEVARLLRRLLEASGQDGTVDVVLPGDRLDVDGRSVVHRRGVSDLVRATGSADRLAWEPIDTSTLTGLTDPTRVPELRSALEHWFARVFVPWLGAHMAPEGSPFRALADWGVVWQLVVHTGTDRLSYWVDFRSAEPAIRSGEHEDANLLVHLGGAALDRVLSGSAGAELFYLSGQARFAEKILYVDGDRVTGPPVAGWDFWETLPEPLSMCLRRAGTA